MIRQTLKEILDLALNITESDSIYSVDVDYSLDIQAVYVTVKENDKVTKHDHRYYSEEFKGSDLGNMDYLKKELTDLQDQINNNGGYTNE